MKPYTISLWTLHPFTDLGDMGDPPKSMAELLLLLE